MRFIQGGQRLRVCPCEPAEDLLKRRLDELDAEMARLAALRAEMVGMIDAGLPAARARDLVPDRDDQGGDGP